MKNLIKKAMLGLAFLSASSCLLIACDKETTTPKEEVKHWVASYSNVVLGNQYNYTYGHFLRPKDGTVVKVEDAQSQQSGLAMLFYTGYGQATYLTFPGNAGEPNDQLDDNRLFTQNPGGLDYWDNASMNSGEITLAATSSKTMTQSEFQALFDGKDWKAFDAKFKEFNSGDANLSFVSTYVLEPGVGDVYMVQLNNSVRAFLYVKNVVPSSANGGNIKFDMVIEGGDNYTAIPEANHVQPSKD